MNNAPVWAVGLMSGTSMDGIDAALLKTDGNEIVAFGPWLSHAYSDDVRDQIRSVLGRRAADAETERVEAKLTALHGDAVEALLATSSIKREEIAVVGFHGQTIMHEPAQGRTWQIGDGAALAQRLGLPVVGDFRSNDMAHGGEGAPLASLYHAGLSRDLAKPMAVLNLGGVGNVTWLEAEDEILAFDTGPANALLDDWIARHYHKSFDEGGAIAASGQIDAAVLARLLRNPYFERKPPKSLDRLDFSISEIEGLAPADGAATLLAFTVEAVGRALEFLPAPPRQWLVTGGGRHNKAMLAALRQRLAVPVAAVEANGWRGDAIEAEAFAYLAVRSLAGWPLSVPGTTGTAKAVSGGRLFRPEAPAITALG